MAKSLHLLPFVGGYLFIFHTISHYQGVVKVSFYYFNYYSYTVINSGY